MLLLTTLIVVLLACNFESTSASNHWPVIGILIQEFNPPNTSYIPSSYVKFVEAGGARVVPIHINRESAYYQRVLSQVNGILFPGGDVDVHNSGFGRAGKIIFDYALRANQRRDYFPLWGTCNGFEMLSYLAVDRDVLVRCDAMNDPKALNLTRKAQSSRLFGKLERRLETLITKEETSANFHERCLTIKNFTEYGISEHYNVLSTNFDKNGLQYVSSMEAKHYPFYAVQFHPEKNIYEWPTKEGHSRIPHSGAAIEVSQFYAQFFINEARKSNHTMPAEVFNRESIYNFNANYTGDNSPFMQMYFFQE